MVTEKQIERALANKYASLTRGTDGTLYALPLRGGTAWFVAPCTEEYYRMVEVNFQRMTAGCPAVMNQ